jgi:DNA-binding MurR/RpiR family transcriptional regulator
MVDPLRHISVDCLATIEQRLPSLHGTARRVAGVIVTDPWAVLDMTIYEVASRSDVSVPSVTRFCRTVGYSGYRDLARGLAQSLARLDARELETLPGNTDGPEYLHTVTQRIVERQCHALQVAGKTIDLDVVQTIASKMLDASRITLIGHGAAYPTALGTAVKLNWAGIPAFAVTPDMFSNQAMFQGAGDIVVGISHQGRTRDVIEALRLSSTLGATTVGISAVPHAPLAQVADHYLAVLSTELAREGIFIVASNALMLAADLLAAAVSEQQQRSGDLPGRRGQVSEWIESQFRVGPLAARAGSARDHPDPAVARGEAHRHG